MWCHSFTTRIKQGTSPATSVAALLVAALLVAALLFVVMHCSVLQFDMRVARVYAVNASRSSVGAVCCSVLQCVAVCCNACCHVLPRVAVCCNV